MTNEEAVALLKQTQISLARGTGKVLLAEALRLAISALEERKRGRWIDFDSDAEKYDDVMCSNCKKNFTVDAYRWCDIGFTVDDLKFCPNCGADMRKGKKECLETK